MRTHLRLAGAIAELRARNREDLMSAAYRTLCAVIGLALIAIGAPLFASFFAYQQPGGEAPLPGGPHVHYFAATAGGALIAWGGALAAGALRNELSRSLGTASAFALMLLALVRILAWFNGDYYATAGNVPRIEAAVLLVAALGFVWLRPARAVPRRVA
jgi:hypothetical protein